MKIDNRTEHLYLNLQGFNRIAAIALLFLNEEDAFWLLVYIVDVVMPLNYYTKQLIGAQVDQAVFKELVTEKLPNLAEHLGNFHIFLYFEVSINNSCRCSRSGSGSVFLELVSLSLR